MNSRCHEILTGILSHLAQTSNLSRPLLRGHVITWNTFCSTNSWNPTLRDKRMSNRMSHGTTSSRTTKVLRELRDTRLWCVACWPLLCQQSDFLMMAMRVSPTADCLTYRRCKQMRQINWSTDTLNLCSQWISVTFSDFRCRHQY